MLNRLRQLKIFYPYDREKINCCYHIARKVFPEYSRTLKEDLSDYAKKSMTELCEDCFDSKKARLISDIKKLGILGVGSKFAQRIEELQTPFQFLDIYNNIDSIFRRIYKQNMRILSRSKKIDLSDDNLKSRFDRFYFGIYVAFYRFLTPITTNPKIKNIENTIRQLGISEVQLGNDEKTARLIYDSVVVTKKLNYNLPNRLFVPIFAENAHCGSDGLTHYFTRDDKVVNISPRSHVEVFKNAFIRLKSMLNNVRAYRKLDEREKELTQRLIYNVHYSTKDERRCILHELGHVNDDMDLPKIKIEDLSVRDRITIRKLSDYVNPDNVLVEAYAELYAKSCAEGIDELTDDEYDLLCRIVGGEFKSVKKWHSSITNFFKKLTKINE